MLNNLVAEPKLVRLMLYLLYLLLCPWLSAIDMIINRQDRDAMYKRILNNYSELSK